MKSQKKSKQPQFFVATFLIIIAAVLIWKYQSSPPVGFTISPSTQKTVDDNYLQYSRLSYVDFKDEKKVVLGFRNAIARQKTDELNDSLKAALADLLAEVLLSKGAGDFDRYERCIRLNASHIPYDEVKYFYQTWFHRDPPNMQNASDLAREMYTLEVRYKEGKHLFSACSFEENAVRMKSVRVYDPNAAIDTAGDLNDDQLQYWLGPIVNSSYLFFVPDVPIGEVVKNHGSVIWVDFQIIVKTKDNDMYPLRIRLWYHPDMNQWIVEAVTRQSTIKGAMYSPPLVF